VVYLHYHTSFNGYYKSVFSGRMHWLRIFRDGAGGYRKDALQVGEKFADMMTAPGLQSPYKRRIL
jgi:hypothetical protein